MFGTISRCKGSDALWNPWNGAGFPRSMVSTPTDQLGQMIVLRSPRDLPCMCEFVWQQPASLVGVVAFA